MPQGPVLTGPPFRPALRFGTLEPLPRHCPAFAEKVYNKDAAVLTGRTLPLERSDTISIQQFFTGAFIIIFSMLTVMRLYYRYVALGLRDVLFNRREGALILVTRYFFGIPLFLAVFAYIFYPDLAGWSYLGIPLPLRFAGVVLGLASIYLIYLAHRELGIYFSSKLVIKKGHRLVTGGPYRFIRHPMYTAYFALFVAAFLITGNWVIGLCGMSVIATLMTLRLGKEEAMLMEHFGDSFASYRMATGMFLPRYNGQNCRADKEKRSVVQ